MTDCTLCMCLPVIADHVLHFDTNAALTVLQVLGGQHLQTSSTCCRQRFRSPRTTSRQVSLILLCAAWRPLRTPAKPDVLKGEPCDAQRRQGRRSDCQQRQLQGLTGKSQPRRAQN